MVPVEAANPSIDFVFIIEIAFGLIVAGVAGVGALYAAYARLKAEIRAESETTRQFVDQSVHALNGTLHGVLEAMPYPAWIKVMSREEDRTVLRMQYINQAYADLFGVRRTAYIGREDFDIWDRETAEAYFRHDMEVIGRGEAIRFVESVPILPGDPEGPKRDYLFEKMPISRGEIRGVFGCLRTLEDVEHLTKAIEESRKERRNTALNQ